MNSIFAVNKPRGVTSHDVVNLVRRATHVKRVGHGGTLDPLATGVLVVAVGRENTKQLGKYVKGEKEYVARIMLGETSTTDDAEGPIRRFAPQGKEKIPTLIEIKDVLKTFVGKISQIPPAFSAIKVRGQTAYKAARKGRSMQLKPRTVKIMRIDLLSYKYPVVHIRVTTGPGVYIRSLARDIGEKLGTGAYLADLERTRVGNFTKEDCITLKQITEHFKED